MYYIHSIEWNFDTQWIAFGYGLDENSFMTVTAFDIHEQINTLLNSNKKFCSGHNVIRCKIWIDGFYISPNSKRVSASLVYLM